LGIKTSAGADWAGVTFFYRMLKILLASKDEGMTLWVELDFVGQSASI
jgi:hypothetical protein